ncbi:MAG: TldD/PmbA family protein [Nitrospinota bacterium]
MSVEPEVREAMAAALGWLKAQGADYADIRWVSERHERLSARNGSLEAATSGEDEGVGVRVIFKGAWGFGATPDLSAVGVVGAAQRALSVARAASSLNRELVSLANAEPLVASFKTGYAEDPFGVPLGEKLELLLAVTKDLSRPSRITQAEAFLEFLRTEKLFMSTEGALISQVILQSGGGMTATATSDGEAQRRSYPAQGGDYVTGGYEHMRALALRANAERVREEALALLKAPPLPSGRYTLILEGSQLALQVHESCGHPLELDRALGFEVGLAGGSFLTPEALGSYRLGSPLVNLTADATIPGGLGSFGFDDEGVPGQRVALVREGVLVDFLSSRETAMRLGKKSGGAMRAEGWRHLPLIRMTNVNLEPGRGSLQELIADTPKGLFLSTNKSWSIDDLRLNFQFGCEAAWEIEGGRLGRLFKNPLYTGITPRFWASCDSVCGPEEWRVWGVANCGKGEPMQVARVGHGVAPARFRDIEVGRARC